MLLMPDGDRERVRIRGAVHARARTRVRRARTRASAERRGRVCLRHSIQLSKFRGTDEKQKMVKNDNKKWYILSYFFSEA